MPSVKSCLLIVLIGVIGSAHAWKPSECPQDCVRPLSFWVENRPGAGAFWPDNSASKKFKCGPTWLEVIESTEINSWTILARQYIAAQLNILSFSCIDVLNITEELSEALNLLSGYYCTVSNEILAAELKASIAEFNNGYGEVATCICPTCPNGGSYPDTECPNCPECPNPPPFTCDKWIVDKCCEKPPVPPPKNCSGCTRTQGYWKTHPEAWTYNFTICNYQALAILHTPSKKGNAFIILARQYIAARLNVEVQHVCINDSDVSKTISKAEELLEYACESGVPEKGDDLRDKFITTAMILDNFNNGHLGPDHCNDRSYDSTSRITEFYVDALESSFAVDDADFSSATAVVPALFCMLMALLAIVA